MRFVPATCVAFVLVLAPGAAADGGGRAESVAFGAGRLWTTVREGVVAVDPATGKATPAIRTAAYGALIAATDRTVWQLQPHSLVAVDVATHRIRLRRGLGQAAYAFAAGAGAVWLPSFDSDTLSKIDARTGASLWRIRVPRSPEAVATGAGSVWLASTGRWHSGHGGVMVPDGRGILLRLDPATGAVRARVLVDRGPTAVAFGSGGAWVLNGRGIGADDTLDRIDARTNKLAASIRVPHWSSAVTVGRRYAWVVSEPKSAGGTITRIDLRTNRGVTRPIPHSWIPQGVVLADGGVWVADPGVAQLIRIDPHSLRVTKRVSFPVS
jgi:DNA-binding beta-propeller fold protein YncE